MPARGTCSEVCSLVIKFGQCFILFVDSTNEKYNKPWWQIMLINKTSWTTVRTARNKWHSVRQQVLYSSSGYDVHVYSFISFFCILFSLFYSAFFSSDSDVSRVPCGATRPSVDVSCKRDRSMDQQEKITVDGQSGSQNEEALWVSIFIKFI